MAELLGGTTIGGYKATHIGNIQEHITETVIPVNPALIKRNLSRGLNTVTADADSPINAIGLSGKTVINFAPPFSYSTGSKWKKSGSGANPTINSLHSISMIGDGLTKIYQYEIQTLPNYTYTLSGELTAGTGVYIDVVVRNDADAVLADTPGINSVKKSEVFSTPAGATRLIIRCVVEAVATSGTYTFQNISLVAGNVVPEYVIGVQGIKNPTIENKTTKESLTIKGDYHEGDLLYVNPDGKVRVRRMKHSMVLNGNRRWVYHSSGTNYKVVLLYPNVGAIMSQNQTRLNIVKYDESIVLNTITDNVSKGDRFAYRHWEVDKPIYITIPMEDSGWGNSYTPTTKDIEAYFNGWKLVNTSGSNVESTTDEVFKRWLTVNFTDGWNPNGNAYTSLRRPTDINPYNYKPYKLYYDVLLPIEEYPNTLGSLRLVKGNNTLEVTEGKIFREVAKPSPDLYAIPMHYRINNLWSVASRETLFEYLAKDIVAVYKNGKIDTNWVIFSGTDGGMSGGTSMAFLPAPLFDSGAVYEVDYTVLETGTVSAVVGTIEIEHATNREGALDQLTKQLATTTNESEKYVTKEMINKPGGIAGINPSGEVHGAMSIDMEIKMMALGIL